MFFLFGLYNIRKNKSIKNGNKIKNIKFNMDNEYLKKFAQHLKKIRKEKNIKQDDFLDVNGISRSTIAMVETAKTDITLSKLKIIADVLGVNLKELVDFD